MILKTYREKMPKYIKRIDKLEESFFYTKERPNAQDRRVIIKAFDERIEVLEENGWFEKLG